MTEGEFEDFSDDGQTTATTEGGEEELEQFHLTPETMAEGLDNDDRTPERIVAMIADVDQRRQLGDELMQNVPAVSAEFGDIEALNQRLDAMAEVLPQKKTFFDRVKENASWALEKVKNVVTHPVVVTILVGLLAWWGWGKLHSILAMAHGEAAEAAAGAMGAMGEGASGVAPEMGPGFMAPGGGVGTPAPSMLDEFVPEDIPYDSAPPLSPSA